MFGDINYDLCKRRVHPLVGKGKYLHLPLFSFPSPFLFLFPLPSCPPSLLFPFLSSLLWLQLEVWGCAQAPPVHPGGPRPPNAFWFQNVAFGKASAANVFGGVLVSVTCTSKWSALSILCMWNVTAAYTTALLTVLHIINTWQHDYLYLYSITSMTQITSAQQIQQ